ncbi:TPA: ead/Ea22-like family protein [Enterobacter asburiae]
MFAYAVQVAVLELRKVRDDSAALAAENAGLKATAILLADEANQVYRRWNLIQQPDGDIVDMQTIHELLCACHETPATDAFLAEVRAQSHKEGAHFVANRMLAAWDAGFIDDTAKNAADIARMILTSTEFMADAPEGDFDRSFADGVLEDIAAQLRKGVQS